MSFEVFFYIGATFPKGRGQCTWVPLREDLSLKGQLERMRGPPEDVRIDPECCRNWEARQRAWEASWKAGRPAGGPVEVLRNQLESTWI